MVFDPTFSGEISKFWECTLDYVVESSFTELKLHSTSETTTDSAFPTDFVPNWIPFGAKSFRKL